MAVTAKSAASNSRRSSRKAIIIGAPTLKQVRWVVHGFSTRPDGVTDCYGTPSLNLGFTKEDERATVDENRRRFLLAVGASDRNRTWPLIVNRQVHSDVIHVIRNIPAEPLPGDGLITNLPRIALGIMTADCFPVLLVDTTQRVVGAFHAGWRGTVRRIVEKGIGIMRREFGTDPNHLRAVIGPGIQQCCYEVGEEVHQEFESQFSWGGEVFQEVRKSEPVREKYPLLFMNARAPGHGDNCAKLHLDLLEANRRQLVAAGVPARQITAIKACTSCDTQRFFSHRAEQGRTGRMMAVIGILK